jgi:hypothetical protein
LRCARGVFSLFLSLFFCGVLPQRRLCDPHHVVIDSFVLKTQSAYADILFDPHMILFRSRLVRYALRYYVICWGIGKRYVAAQRYGVT